MDAAPYLIEIADALADAKLEAILIGNAGAALQGAPVTTVDFDFYYREAQHHADAKIRQAAAHLNGDYAALSRPIDRLPDSSFRPGIAGGSDGEYSWGEVIQ